MRKTVKFLPSAVVAAFFGILTAANAQNAAVPEMPEGCTLQAESKMIRVVVCTDPKIDQAQLAEAGRAACRGQLPCGTWIWSDPESAPTTAPDNHDGLTQAQVTSSKGVWVAEQELFIAIDKVE